MWKCAACQAKDSEISRLVQINEKLMEMLQKLSEKGSQPNEAPAKVVPLYMAKQEGPDQPRPVVRKTPIYYESLRANGHLGD